MPISDNGIAPLLIDDNPKCTDPGYAYGFKPSVGGNEGFIGTYTFNFPGDAVNTVTVENTGTLDAVITSIEDVLAGATVEINCGEEFELPYAIQPGEYTWDLWAAAAQCDTSKGMLVGSVTVEYDDDGYVAVTYSVAAPYMLEEIHVYAGSTMYPSFKGKPTVAPGQYTNNSPFDGSSLYVIAHAVVGIPDPDFGPMTP